ncbi:hypothetical protein [Pseudoduganella sp.]|uniref:hypothetical protein n=1 Tax=Pseudoduganella sp. TaxID=1880898 RepID=UPI0035AFC614
MNFKKNNVFQIVCCRSVRSSFRIRFASAEWLSHINVGILVNAIIGLMAASIGTTGWVPQSLYALRMESQGKGLSMLQAADIAAGV